MNNKNKHIKLGEIILIYRKRKGFSQEELAKLIGVSISTMQNYEKGKTIMDIETLKKLKIILNIPISILEMTQ